jgi:SH3-like domain-containing protein
VARPAPEQPTTGPVTGLPLPRFAALRSDEVNLRVGPDTRFPIEWTYQRRDLPVQIVAEFQLWRRLRDSEGTEGWVHQSTLTGRRTFLVRNTGPEAQDVLLRDQPAEAAPPVARLRPGVVGRLRYCEAGSAWCEAQAGGQRGWLKRSEVWGIGPEEEIK